MFWFLILAIAFGLGYWKVIRPLTYWKRRGIVYKTPWPLFGNTAGPALKQRPFFEYMGDLYKEFPNERYLGIHQFTKPILLIRDLELIKKVTVKDFDHFVDHNPIVPEDVDPLMARNLFSLRGQHWRAMRATLSPSFTGSKMKAMYALLAECAKQFTDHFQKKGSHLITVELKDIFTRFTNDAIATVAFGLKCDSLEERENQFYLMGKDATNFSGGLRSLSLIIINISSTLAKFLKVTFFPKHVATFFRRIIKETIRKREEEGLVRPDMIHLLMEARKGRLKHEEHQDDSDAGAGFAIVEESHVGKEIKNKKPELTDEDITAQALIFFFGGFETSATVMSFVAYELAVQPDIQKKLQSEIDETFQKFSGEITYEALMKMKYLDMVVSETLRKWPPGFQLDRLCVQDYLIEPVNPNEKPFLINKGMLLQISVAGIHRDAKFFPDPEKFDPERFSDENKHTIQPFSYLPFGSGPRNCIASRFALMEVKTLIAHLLFKFDVVVIEKTIVPMKLGSKTFNLMPDGGFWLGLQLRKA